VSLRIAFDLDGVLADMDAALAEHAEVLFGKARLGRAAPTPEPLTEASPIGGPVHEMDLTPRQQRRLWRHIASVENFWLTLHEIEAGSVKQLASVAAARRWQIVFLTKRPSTAGLSAQVQSQRWLAEHGFERPSAYVVKGSRGLIAAALDLDVVVDDRPESCRDIIAESSARAILVCRNPSPQQSLAAQRLGIGVVRTIDECLARLAEIEALGRAPASA
jgi:5' nucleotidase, deoxy (Pyrimidine), cytosolic type C protein (NT5C)